MRKSFSYWYDKLMSFMLTILGFSGTASFIACMYGVEYGPDPDFYKLKVTPSALEFEHLAGETKELRITIEGNNEGSWSAISNPVGYYNVTPTSGSGEGIIYVTTTTDNNSYKNEGIIYITGKYDNITIPII